jgi:hypothetical protein
MGKRELLLIAGFVVLGTIVYSVTAPARPDSQSGFSFSELIAHIRREARGRQAFFEHTTAATHPVPPSITELRVNVRTAEVTIVGEARDDIASELYVRSNGFDDTEARDLVSQTNLLVDLAGSTLAMTIKYPDPGSQRARLKLRVPARLPIQFEPSEARLEVSGVASIEHESARGETIFRNVRGRINATHRGGDLTIEDAGTVRLNTRGSDVKLARITGEAVLQLQEGEFHATDLGGPIELDSTGSDITLEDLSNTRGPIRINADDGTLTLRGLSADARIDGRNEEMNIALDRAAAIAIFNTEEDIDLTPPSAGYALDAVATDGRIVVPEELQKQFPVSETEGTNEQRLSTRVGGGGPVVTIRARGGDIRITPRAATTETR